jgi:hypothetical protein
MFRLRYSVVSTCDWIITRTIPERSPERRNKMNSIRQKVLETMKSINIPYDVTEHTTPDFPIYATGTVPVAYLAYLTY